MNIIKRISSLLPNKPVIIDIGTNKGKEILKFIKRIPHAKIFAFEASPEAFKLLKQNCRKNKNCSLFNIAISDEDGVFDFYLSSPGKIKVKGQNSSSSLLMPHEILKLSPHIKFNKTIKVDTVRLDTFYKQQNLSLIDLIWMDVQGAEAKVIEGGKEILKNTRLLYTEFCISELYRGRTTLDDILLSLPDFKIIWKGIHDSGLSGDILLKNIKL